MTIPQMQCATDLGRGLETTGHLPQEIATSRLRPRQGTIVVDHAIESCYAGMAWRVKLVMLREQLQGRFGASSVVLHTTSSAGLWIGKGKVRAEFRYAAEAAQSTAA